ncbi:MAG: HAD hydrolase family protein [Neisseriaceae bacterium]|nr:MAG: HAD hydrolase family protein [Neisseriaceae bacterium]
MDFYIPLLTDTVVQRAKGIKLLIMDVDGVLSDGKVYYTASEKIIKGFFVRDGLGIVLLHQNNVQTAIITGRDDACVRLRAQELNIKHYFAGYTNKNIAFNKLMAQTGLQYPEIAYIGDDIIDLPIITKVGLAVAVKDAHPSIKPYCHYVTNNIAGQGAVRELCDIILYARNKLTAVMDQFML